MATQDATAGETSTELEFAVSDRDLFFIRASDAAECRVDLEEMVQRSDGRLLEYFTVEDTDPERVLDAADVASGIDGARVVREGDREALYEFVVSGPCIGGTMADAGAVVRSVVAVDGIGRVVGDVPSHADASRVVETVSQRHGADLVARRERERPAPEFTSQAFRATLTDLLTDRQYEALRTAYACGYFAWPRRSTAQECADALGIAQPTFTQHLRAGKRKLMGALFETAAEGRRPDRDR